MQDMIKPLDWYHRLHATRKSTHSSALQLCKLTEFTLMTGFNQPACTTMRAFISMHAAFLKLDSVAGAHAAIGALNGSMIRDRQVVVKSAEEDCEYGGFEISHPDALTGSLAHGSTLCTDAITRNIRCTDRIMHRTELYMHRHDHAQNY